MTEAIKEVDIYFWTQIEFEQFVNFLEWLKKARVDGKLILPWDKKSQEEYDLGKRALELLGVEHKVTIENVVLSVAFLSGHSAPSILFHEGLHFS